MTSSRQALHALGRISFLLVGLAALSSVESEATPPKYVSFSLERARVTLGEPVLLNLQIVNQLSQQLEIDLGADSQEHVQVVIEDPHGKRATRPAKPPKEGIVFSGKVRLAPGETYSQTLVLNEWYNFLETGRYRILVRLGAPLHSTQAVIPTDDFTVEIEITAKDRDRLAAACRSLLTRVQQAPSVASAQQSANALSYVDDPIVVPFLEEVLSDWRVVGTAISGLQRIRSPEAVAALIRALKITKHDTALRSQVALELIASETGDETIRSMITVALKQ